MSVSKEEWRKIQRLIKKKLNKNDKFKQNLIEFEPELRERIVHLEQALFTQNEIITKGFNQISKHLEKSTSEEYILEEIRKIKKQFSSKKITAIHQYAPQVDINDSVTNSMFFIEKLLRDSGYQSKIFSSKILPELKTRICFYNEYTSSSNQIILYHHSIDHTDEQWFKSLSDIKVMLYHHRATTNNHSHSNDLHAAYSLEKNFLNSWKERFFKVIANSVRDARYLEKLGFRNIEIIPLLIDSEQTIQHPYNHNLATNFNHVFTILYVGNIHESMCQLDLIDMYLEFTRIYKNPSRLILVGEVTSNKYHLLLNNHISTLGLADQVAMPGKVPKEDLYAYYRAANVFVSTSEHEGSEIPLIEAMLFDLPVVAYNYKDGNALETLGESGLLFNQKDSTSIAILIELIANKAELRHLLISSQRKNLERFNPITIKNQLVSFLEQLKQIPAEYAPTPQPQTISFQIEGPFDDTHGLSLVNREMFKAFRSHTNNISLISRGRNGEYVPNKEFLEQHQDMNIAWKNGFNTTHREVVLRNISPPNTDSLTGRINIIHNFCWDESELPIEFVQQFNINLSAITVMSQYIKDILISNGVTIPIAVIGPGANHLYCTTQNNNNALEIENNDVFTFLHISSCLPSKGVDILLKAYSETFNSKDKVKLIIKTSPNPHHDIKNQINQLKTENPLVAEIEIINQHISSQDLIQLYQVANAFVAPNCGEGFSLPSAEAMFFKIPVITTGYGGQSDFANLNTAWLIDYQFSPARTHLQLFDSVWVEPSLSHLKKIMLEMYQCHLKQDKKYFEDKTNAAFKNISELYTWDNVLQKTLRVIDHLERTEPYRESQLDNAPSLSNKLLWISPWNCKCAIAEYSKQLSSELEYNDLLILANDENETLSTDQNNIIRCWQSGGSDDLRRLNKIIIDKKPLSVVFQFNFGFFNLERFAWLLRNLSKNNINYFIIFHSTAKVVNESENLGLDTICNELRLANRIFVHSVSDLNRLKSFGIMRNTSLFPHGCLNSEYHDKYTINPNTDELLRKVQQHKFIATFGFLLPNKGIRNLILAFEQVRKKIPEIKLLLLNALRPIETSQLELEKCLSLIHQSDYSQDIILLSDYLSDGEIHQLLKACQLLLFPFEQNEGSSSAAVRTGLASETPVFCSPLPIFENVSEIVNFLDDSDPSSIADGISNFFQPTQELQQQLKEKKMMQQKWLKKHDWRKLSLRFKQMLLAENINYE